MPHVLSRMDRDVSASVVEVLGDDGIYSGASGDISLKIQWVGSSDNIGDIGSSGAWESRVIAYVDAADVPQPRQGDLVWLLDSPEARYRVDRFVPAGGLWELDVIPE